MLKQYDVNMNINDHFDERENQSDPYVRLLITMTGIF